MSLTRMCVYIGDRPPKGAVNPNSWLDKKLDVFAHSGGAVGDYDPDVATTAPLGPMRAAEASPRHLDVLMLFFRKQAGKARAGKEGGQQDVAEDKATSVCLPQQTFVPVRLTIVGRYPPSGTAQDEKAAKEGMSMAGVAGEAVDLKIEWWSNGLPHDVKESSFTHGPGPTLRGAATGAYIESTSGCYDHSWSQSVFLEGLDAAPTYEQSLTSDISPEMLSCWGSYKFDRDRSNCDMLEPSM